ncbi:hypothetical protein JL916_12340 [Staphylococcus pseudintermedius]|uniref:hypothetical protein n=2 Tax=Staphylococcus pseudintermedius TaxID=283734 RepID=UPI0001F6BFA5|nr:hypothetical protein [Staphylococcus pseudintermedius]ADV05395.1 hypothetical protein SPSINT_0867 [Staphylococcus pseudintermedius HKU10-03]EGQ0307152.1 hypothetical protein [Staphylococcus pseudintermedius]EGQ1656360.1 hypothetical protein [Staphylococcus pseudintermedius]EGQ1698045.1 hypothetical protein [Staphylococcus pseudintermedius]EGQ1769601.1 hypothetical protein [Staphylococcus pseudintermedius]
MLKLDKNVAPINFKEEARRIESFNKSQIDLHELNKQENKPVVFKIDNHLPSGMILIDDLINFSQGVQKIYRKAVNSKINDSKKRVRKHIKNSTNLVMTDVRAGSFEIELKQQSTQIIDTNSNVDFDQLTDNVQKHSLNTITNIVGYLHSNKIGKIISEYDLETFKASKEWIKSLSGSNSGFRYNGNNKEYDFDITKVNETNRLFNSFNENFEKRMIIKGILSGVNHQNFTISVNELPSKINYHIKVKDARFKESNYTTNINVTVEVKLYEIMIDDEVISREMYIDNIDNIKEIS